MFMRLGEALMALALVVGGCDRQTSSSQSGSNSPQLEAPGPEAEPARVFNAANDAATSATGRLTSSTALRLADASDSNSEGQEVLTLTGANRVVVEAELTGAVSPATQVQGQTLRALLDI